MANLVPPGPQPLYFGVELEFVVGGHVTDVPIPPSDHSKITSFELPQTHPVTHEPRPSAFEPLMIQHDFYTEALMAPIFDSILSTLSSNRINAAEYDENTFQWTIKPDLSVEKSPPRGYRGPYYYIGVEVTSPVLRFPEDLHEVRRVVDLITSNYVAETNSTCGLHIHLSAGPFENSILSFSTLRKLCAFLWAFEPQLDSLHPQIRSASNAATSYCASSRLNSSFTQSFSRTFGADPGAVDGVLHFLDFKNPTPAQAAEMLASTMTDRRDRYQAYNRVGVLDVVRGQEGYLGHEVKPTIEFRQHEGSLDALAIENWIRTICGITQKLQGMDELDLITLLTFSQDERWEKSGDSTTDSQNEGKYGPTPSDPDKGGAFTIVHLLHYLSLSDLATYYQNRGIHPIAGKNLRKRSSEKAEQWIWQHSLPSFSSTASACELQTRRELRTTFEILGRAQGALSKAGIEDEIFDKEDEMWGVRWASKYAKGIFDRPAPGRRTGIGTGARPPPRLPQPQDESEPKLTVFTDSEGSEVSLGAMIREAMEEGLEDIE